MPAMEPLCHLFGIDSKLFSKHEWTLLEIELFVEIYKELKEIFREQKKEFFKFMKLTTAEERIMLEQHFIQFILKDILHTEEYTIEGIARYTGIHEDVIQDFVIGLNTQPEAESLRKIIEIHKSVRSELYETISKKLLLNLGSKTEKMNKTLASVG